MNFPFICSNIPAAPAYGVYISQLIRYSRAYGSSQDFLDRVLLLTEKLLKEEFLLVKLKSSLRKIYGHHHDLVDRYGIYVSQMITDMFHLSSTFPDPFLIHDITWFVTRLTGRVSLVEQDLLTVPKHLSSPSVFSGVRVTRSLVLYIYMYVCRSFFFLLYFFLSAIVFSVLRYTDSDYPFGIFKLFFYLFFITLAKTVSVLVH